MKVDIVGKRGGWLCVFNCLDSERGREIYGEMIGWLLPLYEVHVVWHDGSRYEYDGLEYMKRLVEGRNAPCLYVHTKGACNFPYWSDLIRLLWSEEFGREERAREYFGVVDRAEGVVACPMQDWRRIPLYNGFVVNVAAMRAVEFRVSSDRYDYERMWVDVPEVDIRPMRYHGSMRGILMWLKVEYDIAWNREVGEGLLRREMKDWSRVRRTYWTPVRGKCVGGAVFDVPADDGGWTFSTADRTVIERIEGSKAYRMGRVKRLS